MDVICYLYNFGLLAQVCHQGAHMIGTEARSLISSEFFTIGVIHGLVAFWYHIHKGIPRGRGPIESQQIAPGGQGIGISLVPKYIQSLFSRGQKGLRIAGPEQDRITRIREPIEMRFPYRFPLTKPETPLMIPGIHHDMISQMNRLIQVLWGIFPFGHSTEEIASMGDEDHCVTGFQAIIFKTAWFPGAGFRVSD